MYPRVCYTYITNITYPRNRLHVISRVGYGQGREEGGAECDRLTEGAHSVTTGDFASL